MDYLRIKSKDVKQIISATFPDYRRREVVIRASNTVRLSDLNWSGGTRSQYRACTIDGRSIENKVDLHFNAPWNNPYEGAEIPVPSGVVVVEGGHFCGKVRTLNITVNPENMPKFIEYRQS